MAEVARLQAVTLLTLIQHNALTPNPVVPHSNLAVAHPPQAQSSPMDFPAAMIISENVGSISVAEWEGMSEDRLLGLDRALKAIIETTMVAGISWGDVAAKMQSELTTAGFVFNPACDSTKYPASGGWKDAENKSLSDMVRIRGAANDARTAFRTWSWVDAMVRITVRLMELRGM